MKWVKEVKDGWGLFLVFIALIPFHSYMGGRVVWVIFLISVFRIRYFDFSLLLRSWDIYLYFLILCFGLLFTDNVSVGLSTLETNFSLVVMPLIFIKTKGLNEKQLDKVFYSFITGLLAACSVCLVNAIINYIHIHNSQVFFFYEFTSILHSQPIYLAYYIIFSITYCLYSLYYHKGNINFWILIGVLCFLFLILMLTGGQTAFISMLFVFSFFILKFLLEARSAIKSISFGLICLMMICMFLINLDMQENRNFILNDSWERFVLWEAAIKAIPDIIWGVGTGDYKDVLNDYYLTHGLNQFAWESYNSHNQFIQILLTNGLFGLGSTFLLICRPLYLSVKNSNILGVLVFFPFLIYGMTEVFLGRYQGVVFFVLVHQIFISHYITRKSITPLKEV